MKAIIAGLQKLIGPDLLAKKVVGQVKKINDPVDRLVFLSCITPDIEKIEKKIVNYLTENKKTLL
jgi:hypothetical protein